MFGCRWFFIAAALLFTCQILQADDFGKKVGNLCQNLLGGLKKMCTKKDVTVIEGKGDPPAGIPPKVASVMRTPKKLAIKVIEVSGYKAGLSAYEKIKNKCSIRGIDRAVEVFSYYQPSLVNAIIELTDIEPDDINRKALINYMITHPKALKKITAYNFVVADFQPIHISIDTSVPAEESLSSFYPNLIEATFFNSRLNSKYWRYLKKLNYLRIQPVFSDFFHTDGEAQQIPELRTLDLYIDDNIMVTRDHAKFNIDLRYVNSLRIKGKSDETHFNEFLIDLTPRVHNLRLLHLEFDITVSIETLSHLLINMRYLNNFGTSKFGADVDISNLTLFVCGFRTVETFTFDLSLVNDRKKQNFLQSIATECFKTVDFWKEGNLWLYIITNELF